MDWKDVVGKPATWHEVFEIWRKNEENLEHWQKFWQSQGFSSWEAWRRKTHMNLQGEKLNWTLVDVPYPERVIPALYGGPFRSWQTWFYSAFDQGSTPVFGRLAQHPGVANHHYVLKLIETFPTETTLTVIRDTDGKIMVIEGMHRACAYALAIEQKRPVQTKLSLAAADWPDNKLPLLGIG